MLCWIQDYQCRRERGPLSRTVTATIAVRSIHSLLKSGGEVTEEQVEQAMDGNLCRCTGYRPILDAFKTFKKDADETTKKIVKDIEVRPISGGELLQLSHSSYLKCV